MGLSSLYASEPLLRFGGTDSQRLVSGSASGSAFGMRSRTSWQGRGSALGRALALHAHCTNCSARGMASLHSRSWLHVRDMASALGAEDVGLEMHSGSIQSWRLGRRSVLARRGTPLDAPQSRKDAIEEMFLRELSRSMDPLTDRGTGTGIEAPGTSPRSDHSGPSWPAQAKGDRESSERRLLKGFSEAGAAWNAETVAIL